MRATVVSINRNAQGTSARGSYTYTELVTQGEPYKGQAKPPRTHKIFKPEIVAMLSGINVGDTVEYTTDQTQYKNLETIRKISGGSAAPSAGSSASPAKSSGGGGGYRNDDPETQLRIARSVALKAAGDIVGKLLEREGTFKKTTKPELIYEEVVKVSQYFEKYLTLQEIAELTASVESLEPSTEDIDQPPFDVE